MKYSALALSLISMFFSCSKDEQIPNLVRFETAGNLNGILYGNAKVRDWNTYGQGQNTYHIKFKKISLLKYNPKALCDSVYLLNINNYIKGYYFDWSYSFYFKESSLQYLDTVFTVFKNEVSNINSFSPLETIEYCNNFPKLDGGRAEHDAPLTIYILKDTATNFIKFDYISKDTIKGSFKASFISTQNDVFFERNSDIDRYITFDCMKFVAVRDTSR